MLTVLALTALVANAQNPYLPLWEHVPDGEPRVFEDPDNPGKLRAYIIGSHDVNYSAYCASLGLSTASGTRCTPLTSWK